MWLTIRRRIIDFFRRNKRKIIIVLIAWVVVFTINYIMGQMKLAELPESSYEKHTPIISGSEVPKKDKEPIEELIDEYVEYCMNKEYDKAYAILSEDCKEEVYPTIESFKSHVNRTYLEGKTYNIKSYSTQKETYTYRLRVIDDIMATGYNNGESDEYEDLITITKKNDTYYLSIQNFILTQEKNIIYEDDYMRIWIEKVKHYYDKEKYVVKIRNKTNYYIVIANDQSPNEVLLNLGDDTRKRETQVYTNNNIFIRSGNTATFEMTFPKYFDESSTSTSIIFNAVRILPKYSEIREYYESELADAIKLYSLTLNL